MKLTHRIVCCFALVLLTVPVMFAQAEKATANGTQAADTPASGPVNSFGFSERHPRYEMQPGDAFDLTFEYTPEFNQTVTVQPDGYVSMRNVGDLYVAGQTVPQVTVKVTDLYGKVLNKPAISILMKDYEKPYFIADGQVGHPGKYELRGDTTVVQAIAMAGGFTSSAKHSNVVLFRRISDQWVESKLLDVKKMQNSKNLSEDVHLRPGDMVFVPKNALSKIEPFLPTSSFNMIPWHY